MRNVSTTLAHLASGTGLECSNVGCVIGCANVASMCVSSEPSFGVEYLSFSTNQALLVSLLAHEMTHNAGN
jgi:hypothetical protein